MNLSQPQFRFTRNVLTIGLLAGLATAQVATGKTRPQSRPAKTKIEATKHPFLWRIDGRNGKTFAKKSWLYGTMHLGDRRLITMPEVVDEARENADALYCELDMVAMGKQQLKLTKMMLLPRGEKLQDRLSPELYERLGKYLVRHGSNIRRFDRLKVWAANMTMATLDVMKEGFVHSLDQKIYKEARADGLEVGGLETLEEQIGAFAGTPESDQIKALENALRLGEEYDAKGRSSMREMLEAYLSGDTDQLLAKLEESAKHDPELSKRIMEPLLAKRNFRMRDRMIEKMEAHPGKSYFFAVGALHFPGKDGLLELLEKKGYEITRIQAPEKPRSRKSEKAPRKSGE